MTSLPTFHPFSGVRLPGHGWKVGIGRVHVMVLELGGGLKKQTDNYLVKASNIIRSASQFVNTIQQYDGKVTKIERTPQQVKLSEEIVNCWKSPVI